MDLAKCRPSDTALTRASTCFTFYVFVKPLFSLPQLDVFDAAERYRQAGLPLIILAGKEYGSGSSRDWAAKGPFLLVSMKWKLPNSSYKESQESAQDRFCCFTFQDERASSEKHLVFTFCFSVDIHLLHLVK